MLDLESQLKEIRARLKARPNFLGMRVQGA